VHAVPGLGERGDRVAEDVLTGRGGAFVQQAGQVAAEDLDVATAELVRDDREGTAVRVHDVDVVAAGLQAAHVVEDAHPAEHGAVGLALEVDGLAAAAQGRRPFDDGDGEAVADEPVGQRGPGDARAGDEDGGVAHAASVGKPADSRLTTG